MSSSDQTRAVTQDVFEALHAHDLDRIRTLLHDDATLQNPVTGEVQRGSEAILDTMRPVLKAFPDLTPEVVNLVVDGQQAAAEVIRRGTHTKPLALPNGTIPPTDETVELPECLVLRVEGEKVTDITAYTDRFVLKEQLGLIEP